ncbi:MAG: hypothetical protein K9J17_16070 [Flavobacteriales bacterium]|nr:hypothetical protein [Flavobacteriales bacterium]
MSNLRVRLKSFLGTQSSPTSVDENENYWKLVGKTGEVLDSEVGADKVLVQFDDNLDDFGLENHNAIKNSLMINKSDLQFLTD